MLLAADEGDAPEMIRVWQFDRPVVVLGRSSRVNEEVDREFCLDQQIPIYRRCSGGAAVLGGPGCLMYSVVLSFEKNPSLQKIDVAHQYVMARVLRALQQQVPQAQQQGICDLTSENRKCSGNSLRIARRHLLYHGTILHDFDLDLLDRCLASAPRQPAYRDGREHGAFVTHVSVDPQRLASDLYDKFAADQTLQANHFVKRIQQLRQQRYDRHSWSFRH